MAVSENDLIVGPITLNPGVKEISLDYPFEREEWLKVYKTGSENPLTLNTDYTTTGEGTDFGKVILDTGASGNDAYSVYLVVPLERSSDLQARGEFRSEPFNKELDRVWQAMQGLSTSITRALRLGKTSAAIPELVFSNSDATDGRALVFSSDSSTLEPGPTSGEISAAEGHAQTALTKAAEAAQSLSDLQGSTASATTLVAGADASASYDANNNTFIFGIPRGATGATGAQGLPGADGQNGADGVDGAGVVAGQIAMFARNTAPDGWLKANGALVNRTNYSDLFAAIGTTFGAGNGTTTFQLPDLRGEFLRGWDDNRGIDNSRSFGSHQLDEFKEHRHTMYVSSNNNQNRLIVSTGIGSVTSSTDGMELAGGSETRPRNVAVLACIKF